MEDVVVRLRFNFTDDPMKEQVFLRKFSLPRIPNSGEKIWTGAGGNGYWVMVTGIVYDQNDEHVYIAIVDGILHNPGTREIDQETLDEDLVGNGPWYNQYPLFAHSTSTEGWVLKNG
jgi:hypothetical protein